VRKTLAYFGLDGTATRQDWARSACEVVPPLLVGAVLTVLVGAGGVAGWALGLLFAIVAGVVWMLVLQWLAPRRRRA
jgi:hypothetical protein